jgi:hypothetical protein
MRLFDFAFVPNYPEPLERLKNLAAKEHWGRGGRMLKSYFNHMFDKVMDDGLMTYLDDGEAAVFHTGLQTDKLHEIYAIFVKNERDDAQDWFFRGFTTEGALGLGDVLSQFDELPERARFIVRAEQAFYSLQSGPPECNWSELILDNVSRIPRHIIDEATDGRIRLPDLRDVGKESYIEYLEKAQEDLSNDQEGVNQLISWLEPALAKSMDQLVLDYKLAVPSWHAKDKCVALMLPLRVNSKDPNMVLAVVWDTEKEFYVGLNLLTLEMAYNNSRLIARPEAEWLVKANMPFERTFNR